MCFSCFSEIVQISLRQLGYQANDTQPIKKKKYKGSTTFTPALILKTVWSVRIISKVTKSVYSV